MNEEIKLRDFFAAQLMSGKVNDFYSAADRKNISEIEGEEKWIQRSAEEVTNERIEKAAKNAYKIADALLKARGQ